MVYSMMWKEKTFGVISLGCDKNRVDTEKLLGLLQERGCRITKELADAQILIINTCAFLQSAREEAIQTALDCSVYKGEKLEKMVLTGCLPEKFIDELYEPLQEADVFLGITDYEKIFDALDAAYRTGERQNFVKKGKDGYLRTRVQTTDEQYAYLKIADGCYNRCTYCLIPKIRGKYRSYPIEALVEEAKELGNVAELILVAQDTTRYGEDLYGENAFVRLLRELSSLDNIQSIRLLYCYPDVIGDALIEEIATNDKILKYIDIPLQHSENRVLKLMNRKGTREGYLALFARLRERIPNIALRSTFISGFPTETEAEFEGMQAFLREAKLLNCGFFAYSREPDTAAYRLQPQIHHATKKRRVNALYALQQQISAEILQGFVGKQIEVLCDGIDYEKSCFVGRAYFSAPDIDGKVYFNAPRATQGKRYQITIEKADAYDVYGKTEDYQP